VRLRLQPLQSRTALQTLFLKQQQQASSHPQTLQLKTNR
jgi:hypothetical protein